MKEHGKMNKQERNNEERTKQVVRSNNTRFIFGT